LELLPEKPFDIPLQTISIPLQQRGQHNIQHGNANGSWVSDGTRSRFIPASQGGNNVTMTTDARGTFVNGERL
jgi:hypothetical protein